VESIWVINGGLLTDRRRLPLAAAKAEGSGVCVWVLMAASSLIGGDYPSLLLKQRAVKSLSDSGNLLTDRRRLPLAAAKAQGSGVCVWVTVAAFFSSAAGRGRQRVTCSTCCSANACPKDAPEGPAWPQQRVRAAAAAHAGWSSRSLSLPCVASTPGTAPRCGAQPHSTCARAAGVTPDSGWMPQSKVGCTTAYVHMRAHLFPLCCNLTKSCTTAVHARFEQQWCAGFPLCLPAVRMLVCSWRSTAHAKRSVCAQPAP